VTLGDDPVAQAMKGLIDHTAGHEHQISLLWAAIQKLSNAKPEECVPSDAQKTEDFDADHLKQLMR
jgi:serine O-acetyltransferase